MLSLYYFYVVYDKLLSIDDTFIHIKFNKSYLSIPLKIVKSHSLENRQIHVHKEIFTDILNKTTESHNNLYSIYF